jgi:hypothetical protein
MPYRTRRGSFDDAGDRAKEHLSLHLRPDIRAHPQARGNVAIEHPRRIRHLIRRTWLSSRQTAGGTGKGGSSSRRRGAESVGANPIHHYAQIAQDGKYSGKALLTKSHRLLPIGPDRSSCSSRRQGQHPGGRNDEMRTTIQSHAMKRSIHNMTSTVQGPYDASTRRFEASKSMWRAWRTRNPPT